ASDLRHRAILSYAENRPAKQAVKRLVPLFEMGDRQIQLTVVAALGNYTGEPGKQKLAALAQTTEDSIVRDELEKYVDLDGIPTSEE
ncbi:MAG: HEAT repeat domain-containing protein, partial [Bradymonadaceae bacterium]